MAINVPRERCLTLAVGVAEILNAVVVGMECTEDSLFDLDAAMVTLNRAADNQMCAALTVLAALFNERGIMPHEIFERTPYLVSQIALQDLE